jgi:hypothetical protein
MAVAASGARRRLPWTGLSTVSVLPLCNLDAKTAGPISGTGRFS